MTGRTKIAVAILLLSVACRPPPIKGASEVSVTNIEAPVGVTLVAACTPSGPELCFNAVDDNCNGVIDEGCGLTTGVMQFTIAWGDSPADVNLTVRPPTTDATVFHDENGFRSDHDCPRDGCNGQNIENVYYTGIDPPTGKYVVTLELEDTHSAALPVRVRFGARIGSKSYGADVELAKRGEKKTFTFTR